MGSDEFPPVGFVCGGGWGWEWCGAVGGGLF